MAVPYIFVTLMIFIFMRQEKRYNETIMNIKKRSLCHEICHGTPRQMRIGV